jgi:hypothetical protein
LETPDVKTRQTARTLFVGGLEVPEHCPEAHHLLLGHGEWRIAAAPGSSVVGLLPPHPALLVVAERRLAFVAARRGRLVSRFGGSPLRSLW